MSFEPSLENPTKRKETFSPALCIVCQEPVIAPSNLSGCPKAKNSSRFQIFIDVCKALQERGDHTYKYLYEVIKGKSAEDLDKENLLFHPSTCRHTFQRILSNLNRKTASTISKTTYKENSVPHSSRRISRDTKFVFNKKNVYFVRL